MGINDSAAIFKIYENEVAILKATFEKMRDTHYPFMKIQKEFVYDSELHEKAIVTIMKLKNSFELIESSDIDMIWEYTCLLDSLFTNLICYLGDCFETRESLWDNVVPKDRLEKLLNQIKTFDEKINSETNSDRKVILNIQKKQILVYLEEHKKILQEECSTFSIYDNNLNSKIVEIINRFEDKEYNIFSYLTVSNSYDAHGKSSDVSIDVIHPVEDNYDRYNYQNTNNLLTALKHSDNDYIIVERSYKSNYFKDNFEYLNLFLEKLAYWREEYYLSNIPEYLQCMTNSILPNFLPIPDEVLDRITIEFIKDHTIKLDKKNVLSKKNK